MKEFSLGGRVLGPGSQGLGFRGFGAQDFYGVGLGFKV